MSSSKQLKSGSYAENLYKRSSFYRDWSNSLKVINEKQSAAKDSESIKEDETLLAKAIYDNLADAPDELSFRKGDIVTVIEQDVDGLVGWWLCLLHGRQGIAPGNRLKVLPSIDSDNKKSPNNSLVSNGSSYSIDSIDGKSNSIITQSTSEYDVLPTPIRASNEHLFESSPVRTPLGAFSSKQNSPYNGLSSVNGVGMQSDYDILPTRGAPATTTKLSPEELYDIPTASIHSDAVYDVVPSRKSIQSSSTIGPNSPQPKFQNVLSAFTAIPEGKDAKTDSQAQLAGSSSSSLYDSPRVIASDPSDMYDYPSGMTVIKSSTDRDKSPSNSGSQELYDVPKSSRDVTHDKSATEDFYSIPPQSGTAFRKNFNFSLLRQDKSTLLNEGRAPKDPSVTANEELYDVPTQMTTSNKMVELYDTPPRQQNVIADQHKDIYDTPPQRLISDQPNELYDTPPLISKQVASSSSDIYDVPFHSPHSAEIYDTPPRRENNVFICSKPDYGKELKRNVTQVYDVPTANTQLNVSSTEVYDTPPSQKPERYDIYDTPSNVHKEQHIASDRICNTLPSNDIYDTPPSVEIYDHPKPNQAAPAQGDKQQPECSDYATGDDLYDTPTKHDVNKVMSDITRFKTTNQSLTKAFAKRNNSRSDGPLTSSSNHDDDDYVDYQDIYGKEPPTEMVKEMEKVSEASSRVTPTKPLRKKSSLDQINMSAVKELKLNQSQAYERLNKLHLAVDTSVAALRSYSHGDWLNPVNLSQNITPIKDMAGKVKLALRLLTEFGLGTVVNGKLLSLDSDVDRIKFEIEPLLESYYRIKVCLLHLESCKWNVPMVRDSGNDKFFATVNAVMILAGQIPDLCRQLTSTLRSNVSKLFTEDGSVREEVSKGQKDRMSEINMKSNIGKSTEIKNNEKSKVSMVTVDDKKVREILELDARRPASIWKDQDTSLVDRPNGADMSPMEMKQEFQSRRQKGYNSTLPRRPPVPPKPNLPSNRRSMAAFVTNDDELLPTQTVPKADTLVTDFITEDGRKKYASDPSRSPVEPEPTRRPEWGGSCPQLDDHVTYSTPPQGMLRATSSGTAASSTSTTSLNMSADDLDANANLNKMASDSNLFAQTMIPARVTEPVGFTHVRSASLPWDENKIPFTSYEKQQNSSSKPPQGNLKRLSKLDHRDSEAIVFFLQRVESQVLILRDAVRNLTESVSNSEAPQLFVPHSKFVILTAHKVVHAGEELSGKLLSDEVKTKIKRATGSLADSIRGVVAGTKQAALDYPNQNSLMEMMTTVLSVGESVREVHKEAKKALEL